MAKKAAVERNKKRQKLSEQYRWKRQALNDIIKDKSKPMDERMAAVQKLAKLPKNSARIRIRNRCLITGRPRGYYRRFGMSRIALRELGSQGLIPGVVKSSW